MKNVDRTIAWLACLCIMLISGPAFAQGGLDFSGGDGEGAGEGDGEGESGGGLDFGSSSSSTGIQAEVEMELQSIAMPDGSKPIIAAFFYPADATKASYLFDLGDALTKHFNEMEKYDAVHGLAIYLRLIEMGPDDGEACVYEPACLSNLGKTLGVEYIVVGRITLEDENGVELPSRISLDVVKMEDEMTDILEFEVSRHLRKQREQLRPAAYRIVKEPLPGIEDIMVTKVIDEPFLPPLPEWQMWAAIGTGGAAVTFFAVGLALGADAKGLETDISVGVRNASKTQRQIESMIDEAETSALVANVMFGLGAVALAGVAIFLFVRPDKGEVFESSDDASTGIDFYVAPQIDSQGVGLTGGMTF